MCGMQYDGKATEKTRSGLDRQPTHVQQETKILPQSRERPKRIKFQTAQRHETEMCTRVWWAGTPLQRNTPSALVAYNTNLASIIRRAPAPIQKISGMLHLLLSRTLMLTPDVCASIPVFLTPCLCLSHSLPLFLCRYPRECHLSL